MRRLFRASTVFCGDLFLLVSLLAQELVLFWGWTSHLQRFFFQPHVWYILCSKDLYAFSRNRTHLVVKGLPGDSSHGPDQLRARLATLLQSINSTIGFSVLNVITYPSASTPVYDVELDSAAAVSSLIREFFKFTRRQDPVRRPPGLERVSIYNSVTPGTRIRISLLRVRWFLISPL